MARVVHYHQRLAWLRDGSTSVQLCDGKGLQVGMSVGHTEESSGVTCPGCLDVLAQQVERSLGCQHAYHRDKHGDLRCYKCEGTMP